MEELRLQVLIDPSLGRHCEGAVAFGDFDAVEGDPLSAVYDGVVPFFHDLVMGRPFPLVLATRGVRQVGDLIAIALFLHRDLAVEPGMSALVTAADLVDRYKFAGLAHVDRDLARFFRLVTGYLPPGIARKEQQERLTTAVGWVRDYVLEGRLPSLPREPAAPRVVETGTNGFVVAEMPVWRDLEWGWVELFRLGYLRGVVFGSVKEDYRAVLIGRKSAFLAFDLRQAAEILNEAERRLGEPAGWSLVDSEWLRGPVEGTLIPPSFILDVLVRV